MARRKDVPCVECGALIWTGNTRCGPCHRLIEYRADPEARRQRAIEQSRIYRDEHRPIKVCAVCGKTVPKGRARLCSDECSAVRQATARQARYVPKPTRMQPCGTPAAYRRGCRCDQCVKAKADLQRTEVVKRRPVARAHGHKRRATMYLVEAEQISDLTIFERDGWRCHLCRKLVRRTPRRPRDPRSASLDHIVPLSKGGTHTRDNVACAHLSCNVRKNASLGQGVQPLLVG